MRRKLKRKLRKFLFEARIKYGDLSQGKEINWIYYEKEVTQEKRFIPKIIWIYWDSINPNPLIDICLDSVKKHCSDYEIHILNEQTVEQYIGKIPQFKVELPVANISDYIRLALLSKYGGIWMDASIFLTENFDWVYEKYNYQDAFVLYSDDCTTDLSNPITETWLIFAPENSQFVRDWFDEFTACITSEHPHTYFSEIYTNKEFLQNIIDYNYLLSYLAAISILRKNKYNLLYANSGALGHYYNYLCKWDGNLISHILLKKNKLKVHRPKLLKITGPIRPYIETVIQQKNYSSKSIFGEIFAGQTK